MKNTQDSFLSLIDVADGRALTDSRKVATFFGKRHDNVLRAWENIGCSEEFNRLNFEEIKYADSKGRIQRSISMTKDGFVLLAMGFKGKQAMVFKEAYIAAFNAMADHLKTSNQNLWMQRYALEAKSGTSKAKGSFGSRLMLERKREKPQIEKELQILDAAIQPSLLN